ncbi:hypothetical protein S7711_00436 [Stachybotrys chartarum IBT 7711]|uniref:Peptidase S26 domain-containing protein n=1 Tax=Stachybotrys chartarum (strain CBS 109288 / IBT 7711) TaxID=1280523 RepID=A0A084B9P9_STACB|nr:hypothetical protein S7711_00436 [Stachybotrys chartarum IBT 7711]
MAFGSIWARIKARKSLGVAITLKLIGYATWVPVIVWFHLHVGQVTAISGPSMYPFLNEDGDKTLRPDWAFDYRFAPQSNLERGMIVSLRSPNNPQTIAVKRIVALEGDVVRTKPPYPIPTVVVPRNHVWVEGDGQKTLDSNTYGPVSKHLLTGKITHILYPFRKMGPVKWREHETAQVEVGGRTRPPAASHRFYGTSALVVLSCGFRHSPSFIAQEVSSSGFVYAERPPDPTANSAAPSFGVPSSGMPWSLSISDYFFSSGPSTEPSGFKPLPGPRHADQQAGDFWDTDSDKKLLSSKDSMGDEDVDAEGRPPYLHAMIAGGIGGSTGDLLMHSLDTVKTRQQGDPNIPAKYTSLGKSYYTIWRQEGIRRGLYGGWIPALSGSFPGTMLFFGTYEISKRFLIDHGLQHHLAYLSAGFLGDLASSIVYVPSEVLKTRLQLQGRYKNPYFKSGYNYRGTIDAIRTIVRTEGTGALFYGYKATLYRDLPFSALQFMFWEQFHAWARQYKQSRDVGVPLELLTGAAAGGLAGVITCPLDVVKTRLQTQVNVPADAVTHIKDPNPQKRAISTSSPSTHRPIPGAISLQTSSVLTGLRVIYRTEGISGWFRGVGPRGVWTFIQSGCMLFLYQRLLRQLAIWDPVDREDL